MATGVIQSYDETKGYGYISSDGSGGNLPFSLKAVRDMEILPANTRVNYDEKQGAHGGVAINITQV